MIISHSTPPSNLFTNSVDITVTLLVLVYLHLYLRIFYKSNPLRHTSITIEVYQYLCVCIKMNQESKTASLQRAPQSNSSYLPASHNNTKVYPNHHVPHICLVTNHNLCRLIKRPRFICLDIDQLLLIARKHEIKIHTIV